MIGLIVRAVVDVEAPGRTSFGVVDFHMEGVAAV
jgi:hypothetical protein